MGCGSKWGAAEGACCGFGLLSDGSGVEDMKTPWTEGPWEYVPSNENHGAYVVSLFGSDICDCYTMSNPSALSVRNGGDSRPIHFMGEQADANARLMAAAPDMAEALDMLLVAAESKWGKEATSHSAIGKARAALAKARGES